MNCDRPDELAERYVQGALGEDEQAAFEDHYFDCSECFARVQALEEAREALAEAPVAAGVEAAAREAVLRGPRLPAWAMAAGVAAAALGAVVALRGPGVSPPPPSEAPPFTAAPPPTLSPVLAELARVPPAPYVPLTLRGGPDRRDFEQAMGPYLKQDYAGAATGLRAVVQRRPSDLEARFYLGVAELLAGEPGAAARDLQAVADSRDETLRDTARFYLAKAALADGHLDEARRWLRLLTAGSSDYAAPARDLMRKLDALPAPPAPEGAGRREK